MSQQVRFSARIADEICERLAEGHSLRSICRDDGMPRQTSVFRWIAENPAFREQYMRAREAQADALADEILDIADDGQNDTYVDDQGNSRTDHDVIARSRLRVEARKWIASKLKPKVYGDKLQQEHSGPDGQPLAPPVLNIVIDGDRQDAAASPKAG